MNPEWPDERLNALVDGEMAPAEAAALLERLAEDSALRERVGQLQLAKALVRHAYAGVSPPPAARTTARAPGKRARFWRLAAALGVFGAGLLMGWVAREGVVGSQAEQAWAAAAPAGAHASGRVVLHLSSADPAQGLAVLERAEGLIQAARGSGQAVTVEIVANGTGLNLLREGVSPYAQRIESMRQAYPALTLVACGQTVQRLREGGVDVRLLPGTVVASSALDQIVLRMQQGWSYVRM